MLITITIYLTVGLVVLSLIAGALYRRANESKFVSGLLIADLVFFFIGFLLIALANAFATNPFAKYEAGFPNVDTGGLPAEVFIGNMLIFAAPLITFGIGRGLRRFVRWVFSSSAVKQAANTH